MKKIKWRKKYTPRKLKRKKGQPKEKKPQIYSIKFKNCLFFFLMITKMNKSKTTPQKSQMFQSFQLETVNNSSSFNTFCNSRLSVECLWVDENQSHGSVWNWAHISLVFWRGLPPQWYQLRHNNWLHHRPPFKSWSWSFIYSFFMMLSDFP